jgi:hypothetical protein
MGITSLDVSDDGKEIVLGTIAAFGDPNVIVLDDAGKIVRHYKVGQQWIDDVAFLPGGKEVIALCTAAARREGVGPPVGGDSFGRREKADRGCRLPGLAALGAFVGDEEGGRSGVALHADEADDHRL